MQIYSLHKRESFLKGKKNNILSEKLGGGYKVINVGEPVGDEMIPRNMWFLMCCFDIFEMPGLPDFIIGKENREKTGQLINR